MVRDHLRRYRALPGRYEQANARLVKALGGLTEAAWASSTALLIELTLNEFYRSRYEAMHHWAERAVRTAREAGDPPLMAAAAAMLRSRMP